MSSLISAGWNCQNPTVTVLMPVYNGEPYLQQALESILQQTFTDFEFLIINDGSTDNSSAIIKSYEDSRIRLVENGKNLGLVPTLNRGLAIARGTYLARMDCDDVSLPERLEKQVAFMDANPTVGVCGSWIDAFSTTNRTIWAPPLSHDEIFSNLLFESVIYHPTVIIRKVLLESLGLRYDELYPHAEDYELWSRCGRHCQMANIGEVLLHYRLHDQSVSNKEHPSQLTSAARVRARLLQELGVVASSEELSLNEDLALWRTCPDRTFLERSYAWLIRLADANRQRRLFPVPAFECVLARRWYHVCSQASAIGGSAYRSYFSSPLHHFYPVSWRYRLFFMLRCLLSVK